MKKYAFTLFVFVALVGCSEIKKKEASTVRSVAIVSHQAASIAFDSDSMTHQEVYYAYDELSNEDCLNSFTISEYNTDIQDIKNIERPTISKIENPVIPTKHLFGIWVGDPSPATPHATFWWTEKSFLVVDYDGDGNMPYLIKGDSLIVYYNDFIKKGRLIESTNPERLIIHWEHSKRPTTYYTWKN